MLPKLLLITLVSKLHAVKVTATGESPPEKAKDKA